MVLHFLKSSYKKVKSALGRSRSLFGEKIAPLFQRKIDEETLEELEQVLYEADLGAQTAIELTEKIQQYARKNPKAESEDMIEQLKSEMMAMLDEEEKKRTNKILEAPHVILIVGVNGNGKTTAIAKLAKKFKDEGKKVLLAAADTYRAAAVEQLGAWGEKIGVEIVKGKQHGDPAAVAFDAMEAARSRGSDIVLIDTAGRLHTKQPLMKELKKIQTTCGKVIPSAPHETLMVMDATTGQNGVEQAKIFNEYTPLTGLILTKLDGSAKGGVIFRIHEQLHVPVEYIGVGEGENDLLPFDAKLFIDALFE